MRALLALLLLTGAARAENSTYHATGAVAIGATTNYFALAGGPVPSATVANVNYTLPRAVVVWRMDCAAASAAGASQTRTFTIATGATPTDSALTCTTAANGTSCSSTSATGVTIAAGTMAVVKTLGTATAATSLVTCEVQYTYQ